MTYNLYVHHSICGLGILHAERRITEHDMLRLQITETPCYNTRKTYIFQLAMLLWNHPVHSTIKP